MSDVAFPQLTRFAVSSFRMINKMRGRQTAISGAESIIPSFAGHWAVAVTFVIHGEDARLEWQGFLAQMEGGIGTTDVPIYLQHRPKDGRGGNAPHNVKPAFNTFEHWSFVNTSRGAIVLENNAALRATDLSLTLNDSLGLRPGHAFSIGDRFYRVQQSWDNGTKVRVEPPLRSSAAAGEIIETDNPVCKMRFVSEGEGEVDFGPRRIDSPTVTFREAF